MWDDMSRSEFVQERRRVAVGSRWLRSWMIAAVVVGLVAVVTGCTPIPPPQVHPDWGWGGGSCDSLFNPSGGPTIDTPGVFGCAMSDSVRCQVVDENYLHLDGSNIPGGGIDWARRQPLARQSTPRYYGVTDLERTTVIPDTPPGGGALGSSTPGAEAIAAGVSALATVDIRGAIVIYTVDTVPVYECPSSSPSLVRVKQVPATFTCQQVTYISGLGLPWVFDKNLGWCDADGSPLTSPGTPPIPSVPQFQRGNLPTGYFGQARVCRPSGTTATSLAGSEHWDYGSPRGRWFNVSPKSDDVNSVTAWISGVPFYVPTVDLCVAIGDNHDVVSYGYSGDGYVCNDTGTIGTFLGATRPFPYERPDGPGAHTIRPYVNGGPASWGIVELWDQGSVFLVPRADVCTR